MGRTPTRNKNLPAGMRARHRGSKVYYYLDTGATPRREIPLGQDYVLAVQKWAELTVSGTAPGSIITFRHVAERYQREILPGKAAATQEGNLRELANLYKFFDDPPVALDEIDPVDVRQYIDWRITSTVGAKVEENVQRAKKGQPTVPVPKDAGSVRANREKALFSHIWNFARSTGLTSKANPCAGVKGKSEKGRDAYIDDSVFKAVWDAAELPLRDAMDLAYLTGQRPADVLKLSQADIKDGALTVVQNKTGKRLRIAIEGELAAVIERIKQRKVMGLGLVNTMTGERMGKAGLRSAFDRARTAAKAAHPALAKEIAAFQFRDLRAKAGTDKEESGGMEAAQAQLGHSTPTMTAHYVRHRRGKLVTPTK